MIVRTGGLSRLTGGVLSSASKALPSTTVLPQVPVVSAPVVVRSPVQTSAPTFYASGSPPVDVVPVDLAIPPEALVAYPGGSATFDETGRGVLVKQPAIDLSTIPIAPTFLPPGAVLPPHLQLDPRTIPIAPEPPSETKDDKPRMSTGAKVGIGLALAGVAGVGVYLVTRRKKARRRSRR